MTEQKKIHSVTFPTSWGNVSGRELSFFIEQQAKMPMAKNEAHKKALLEKLLEKCAIDFYKAGKKFANTPAINKGQLYDLKKLLVFLLEETTLQRNLFPEIKIGDVTYYGPDDSLTNARFWEFLNANKFYIEYLKGKQSSLNNFMATIYRPVKKNLDKNDVAFDGDVRELYNDTLCEKRADLFKKVDFGVKKCTALFFTGSSSFLRKRFGNAFEEGGKPNEFGIHGVIDNMAGEKWGKIEEAKQTLLYHVLIGVCQAATRAEEIEMKYGKN